MTLMEIILSIVAIIIAVRSDRQQKEINRLNQIVENNAHNILIVWNKLGIEEDFL